MFVIFLCGLAVVFSLPTTLPVIRVDQDYTHDAPRSSWITINLAHPTTNIKSVMWCKSITPNAKHPPALNDCKGPGLTHLELFPGRVRVLPEEPNTVYVDPDQIGGWDTEHQYVIIVLANVKERNAQLMQVVRFNALSAPLGAESVSSSGKTLVIQTAAPPPNGGGSTVDAVVSSSTSVDQVLPLPSSSSSNTQHERPIHPWLATGLVFGIGMLIFVILGTIIFAKKSGKMQQHAYKQQTDYEFNKLPSLDEDIELQDMSILMKLGKGANEAFKMNLN